MDRGQDWCNVSLFLVIVSCLAAVFCTNWNLERLCWWRQVGVEIVKLGNNKSLTNGLQNSYRIAVIKTSYERLKNGVKG